MFCIVSLPVYSKPLLGTAATAGHFTSMNLDSQESDEILMNIVRSIRPRTELQFQIHREGWRIRIAREAEGLESYSDSPAFEMDLKLLRGPREN